MKEDDIREPPRRATLKDVARAVGVHVSTVSRALNSKTSHLITSEVRDRIKQACADLDYLPNRAAKSLRTRRTMTIGVVIPDITNHLFPPIIRGIDDGLAERGYVAIIANTDADPARERTMVETLLARSVDGLIMANAQRQDKVVAGLAERAFEVVTVNRRVDDPRIPSVVNDEESGIRAMVEHLVSLGHRSIVHIGGPQKFSTGRRRWTSFREGIREFGLDAKDCPAIFADAYSECEGARCAELVVNPGVKATALLCANDLLAVGAIAALKRHGIDCPGKMSVTGFNDMPFADRLDPPLTTVRVQHYAVGRLAAHILVDRLDQAAPVATRHEVMPVDPVIRASSGPAAGLGTSGRRRSASV